MSIGKETQQPRLIFVLKKNLNVGMGMGRPSPCLLGDRTIEGRAGGMTCFRMATTHPSDCWGMLGSPLRDSLIILVIFYGEQNFLLLIHYGNGAIRRRSNVGVVGVGHVPGSPRSWPSA
jgi:hypothetical protein